MLSVEAGGEEAGATAARQLRRGEERMAAE